MSSAWESLRREARRCENEVESKLTRYAKLAASLSAASASSASAGGGGTGQNGAAVADARASGTDGQQRMAKELVQADALGSEIEALLRQLHDANEQMASLSRADGSASAALLHTLQRHREILAEHRQELRRLRGNVRSAREHAELFGNVRAEYAERRRLEQQQQQQRHHGSRGEGAPDDLERGVHRGDDEDADEHGRDDPSLERERQHLYGAERATDSAMGQGTALRDDLMRQRQMFASMVQRMGTVAESMPSLNRLIAHIRRKKRRDVLVLGVVIGVLLFVTLAWKLL